MTHRDEGDSGLTREEEEFVERLRSLHAPAPMPPARRAAFLREVNARLEARTRRRVWIPALVAPAVAAAVAWLYFAGWVAPPAGDFSSTVVVDAAADARWVQQVFYPPELSESESTEEAGIFPDDYLAIGSELLGS